ncbi:hypothetical protein GGI21_002829, partial [Coemansia aciculifera]
GALEYIKELQYQLNGDNTQIHAESSSKRKKTAPEQVQLDSTQSPNAFTYAPFLHQQNQFPAVRVQQNGAVTPISPENSAPYDLPSIYAEAAAASAAALDVVAAAPPLPVHTHPVTTETAWEQPQDKSSVAFLTL